MVIICMNTYGHFPIQLWVFIQMKITDGKLMWITDPSLHLTCLYP